MKKTNQRLAAAFLAAALLTVAGCSNAQVSSTASKLQSQGAPILTNLTDQAMQLGEKARSAANNAVELASGFIDSIKSSNLVDSKTFQAGWDSLKAELQKMADNAASEAGKAKINELKTSLETEFNAIMTKINSNGNVEDIKTAVSNFWTEARTKINELTK